MGTDEFSLDAFDVLVPHVQAHRERLASASALQVDEVEVGVGRGGVRDAQAVAFAQGERVDRVAGPEKAIDWILVRRLATQRQAKVLDGSGEDKLATPGPGSRDHAPVADDVFDVLTGKGVAFHWGGGGCVGERWGASGGARFGKFSAGGGRGA